MARRFSRKLRAYLLLLLSGSDVCERCKATPTEGHWRLCFQCRYRVHMAANDEARAAAGMNREG